jgi:hypothetical protein
VGIIWLLETAYDKISGAGPDFSSISPESTTAMPVNGAMSTKRQRPFLSSRENTKTYSQHLPDMNGEQSPRPRSQSFTVKGRKDGMGETAVVDYARLQKELKDLTESIRELTASVRAQRGIPGSEEP